MCETWWLLNRRPSQAPRSKSTREDRTMNSNPPLLPPAIPSTPARRGHSGAFALIFLAVGLAPTLVGLVLIFFTHARSSSVDLVLRRFFLADTVCVLVSGIGIALTREQTFWLRLFFGLATAMGLWGINALVGLFAGCALTTPGR